MMFAENKAPTVENIRLAAERGDFHATVEDSDPTLTKEEGLLLARRHMAKRNSLGYKIKRFIAERIADIATGRIHAKTELVGMERLELLPKGAIFTSTHYGPLDSTAVRKIIKKIGGGKLNIVSKVSNFAMTGLVGFLMNYTRTVPILARDLAPEIAEMLKNDEYVLIYPEASMWFGYKKPRPHLPGAYYYAAKNFVPVVPIFTEMIEDGEDVRYRVHIGEPIFPDIQKTHRENARDMCEEDFRFKRATYEKVYGKPLDYAFTRDDIAGIEELLAPKNNKGAPQANAARG